MICHADRAPTIGLHRALIALGLAVGAAAVFAALASIALRALSRAAERERARQALATAEAAVNELEAAAAAAAAAPAAAPLEPSFWSALFERVRWQQPEAPAQPMAAPRLSLASLAAAVAAVKAARRSSAYAQVDGACDDVTPAAVSAANAPPLAAAGATPPQGPAPRSFIVGLSTLVERIRGAQPEVPPPMAAPRLSLAAVAAAAAAAQAARLSSAYAQFGGARDEAPAQAAPPRPPRSWWSDWFDSGQATQPPPLAAWAYGNARDPIATGKANGDAASVVSASTSSNSSRAGESADTASSFSSRGAGGRA